MKNNNRKRFNLYTQVQRLAARGLLIVGCISVSAGSALAVLPGPAKIVKFACLSALGVLSAAEDVVNTQECGKRPGEVCPADDLSSLRRVLRNEGVPGTPAEEGSTPVAPVNGEGQAPDKVHGENFKSQDEVANKIEENWYKHHPNDTNPPSRDELMAMAETRLVNRAKARKAENLDPEKAERRARKAVKRRNPNDDDDDDDHSEDEGDDDDDDDAMSESTN